MRKQNFLMAPLIFGVIFLFFLGCQNKEEFVIEAKFDFSKSKRVYLAELDGKQIIPLDSAILPNDGAFKFKTKPVGLKFYVIVCDAFQAVVLAEKGTTAFLKVDLRDTTGNYTQYGNEENKNLFSLNEIRLKGTNKMRNLMIQSNGAKTATDTLNIIQKGEQIQQGFKDQIVAFIQHNPNSFACFYALNFLDPDRDFPVYKTLSENAGVHFKGNAVADSITKLVKDGLSTAIGQEAPEIKLPDPKGVYQSTHSLRGKYVMLDFWASWCGPCRGANPGNLKIYNAYKDKGFTIFGVSLDKDKEEWVKGIKDDNLPWVQVSELKYWDSEVVSTFHLTSIPHNIILDPKGIIIAKNLNPKELENFLSKTLGAVKL